MLFYNFSFFINFFVIPEMLTRTINQKIPFCFNYRTRTHYLKFLSEVMIRLFDWNLEWVSSTQKSNLAGASYQLVLDI